MYATQTSSAPAQTAVIAAKQVRVVLIGVICGVFVSAIDQTIVGTALPKIIGQLQGLDRYSWVFTAYMLTEVISTPIWGKLSDLYGRKRLFLTGIGLFLLGSMLCGLAQTMDQLILFRAIQGLGGGAMLPIASAIIGDLFPPAERAKYQGLVLAVFGVASIFGPALGGFITDNRTWRWVFYVNVPVALAAIGVISLTLPGLAGTGKRRVIDFAGVALLIVGVLPLLLAFTWGGSSYEWVSPQIIGLFAFAVVALALFMYVEHRVAEPIMSPALLRSDIFTVSAVASFIAGIALYGGTLYIALFIQGVLGQSATQSGLVTTPTMIGFIVGSVVSGQLISRTGHYRTLAVGGFVVAAAGLFLLATVQPDTSLFAVSLSMVVFGLGAGGAMLFTVVVQNASPHHMLGEATSTLTFFRSIGGTVGTAIMGGVLTSSFNNEFLAHLPQTLVKLASPDRLNQLRNPQILLDPNAMAHLRAAFGVAGQSLADQVIDGIRIALSIALHNTFLIAAALMIVAAVLCLFLREIPLRRTHEEHSELSS